MCQLRELAVYTHKEYGKEDNRHASNSPSDAPIRNRFRSAITVKKKDEPTGRNILATIKSVAVLIFSSINMHADRDRISIVAEAAIAHSLMLNDLM